ncbi:MAG: manno-octulosonate cytidylyltransferase [Pseudomonadota bacterium]
MSDGARTLIVIPARYGSSRFPGKPLAEIGGRAMVLRVADAARAAAEALGDAALIVATDDQRILDHCAGHGVPALMTPEGLATGSDRVLAAVEALGAAPEVVVNLQGDAPFTPPGHLTAIVEALRGGDWDAATPVVRLDWPALDAFRQHKKTTPFSGTTCVAAADGRALWFSKQILPAIRDEARLRAAGPLSPVRRHVGLYAYRLEALNRFAALPPSPTEQLEGLEQLRLLENGMSICAVEVDAPGISIPGVDTPEDLALAERLLAEKERGG